MADPANLIGTYESVALIGVSFTGITAALLRKTESWPKPKVADAVVAAITAAVVTSLLFFPLFR